MMDGLTVSGGPLWLHKKIKKNPK